MGKQARTSRRTRPLGGLPLHRGGMLLVALCGVALWAQTARSEPPAGQQTREERLYEIKLQEAELALKRAQISRDRYRREYEEAQKLFEEDVIPLPELNESRRAYEQAALEFEAAKIYRETMKLEFLRAATNISGTKYSPSSNRRPTSLIAGISPFFNISSAFNPAATALLTFFIVLSRSPS